MKSFLATWFWILVFSVGLSTYGYLEDKKQHPASVKPQIIQADESATASSITIIPNEPEHKRSARVTQEDRDLLGLAWNSWAEQIGAMPIRRPSLIRGGYCGVDVVDVKVIACSIERLNIIILIDTEGYDEYTILLHELGHLLGVPHIEGDPLMDPNYHKPLEAPSKFAVALAQAAQEK